MARTNTQAREQVDSLTAEIMEYQSIKAQVEELEKRKKQLRDSLIETVEILGETDPENGNINLALDQEINGTTSLQSRRRVKSDINTDRALDILTDAGLLEECSRWERVVDEDAVVAAEYEGRLTEEQLFEMWDTQVTWALHLK